MQGYQIQIYATFPVTLRILLTKDKPSFSVRNIMHTHIKIVGWLNIIFAMISIIGALCLSAVLTGSGLISNDQTAITVLGIISSVAVGTSILFSIPEIVAGIGVLKYKPWARILMIILGIFDLLAFPLILPALFGIYTLWVMLNSESQQIFEGNPQLVD
jgi:hypothetical protein